jgi:hypothetical protein
MIDENDFHCHLHRTLIQLGTMRRHTRPLRGVSPASRSFLPRFRAWFAVRDPNDSKALTYGFFAIGAFLFGCAGYLGRIVPLWGLALGFVAALGSFALARHHMEEDA